MDIIKFKEITGIKDEVKLKSLFDGINEVSVKYSINTPLRMAHFLAQIMHESLDFTAVKENLNYSTKALLLTFPKYFTPEQAKDCERNQEKIGNRAYASRMGNGDIKSGDGYKFRGRSYIMITGKINYTDVGKSLGIDLISKPELLEEPKYALLASAWWWNSRNLNTVADKALKDVKSVTKIVNGGYNHLNDRQERFNKIYPILMRK